MFQWLFPKKRSAIGLPALRQNFSQMLMDAHREMTLGCGAFLRQLKAEDVADELFTLDKQINRAERTIRRELFINAVIYGERCLVPCFTLMSLVKDAERLGDIAKNFYDLAVQGSAPSGGMLDQMAAMQAALLELTIQCRKVFEEQNEEEARELIFRVSELEDDCDEQIGWYLKDRPNPASLDVVYALALRYFKRYAAHLRNITSAVVQPLHKIDFTGKIVKQYREENV